MVIVASRLFIVLAVSLALFLVLSFPGFAQQKPRFSHVQTAIGMPGSLGIAGLDALTEFCEGQRNEDYRSQTMALVRDNFSGKQSNRLIDFYDRRYEEWRTGFLNGGKENTCSESNVNHIANPNLLWGKMAEQVGLGGLIQ